MALDSLLALLKGDVSAVADVQANNGAASDCNGSETAGVADVSQAPRGRPDATAATSAQRLPYQLEPASLLGCTAATAATAKSEKAEGPEPDPDAPRWRWTITHAPGDLREHDFQPLANLAQVRRWYPKALHIEPAEAVSPQS